DVPVMVRSSFSDVEGTWIVPEAAWMREFDVCGVAVVKEEGRVSLTGVPDRPGVSHRVFAALAEKNIVVDMIAQSVGMDGRATIGFTVPKHELPATRRVLAPLAAELGATVGHDDDVSKVSIVGAGMRTRTGGAQGVFVGLAADGRITIAAVPDRPANCSAVFEAVARGGIVVDMIVQSLTDAGRAELSFTVPRTDLDRAAGLARDAAKLIDPAARVTADGDIAVLFVYGVGMRTHTGVAQKMFGALAARDINIAMINTSEVCVSVVVDRRHGPNALAGLRGAFEIEQVTTCSARPCKAASGPSTASRWPPPTCTWRRRGTDRLR